MAPRPKGKVYPGDKGPRRAGRKGARTTRSGAKREIIVGDLPTHKGRQRGDRIDWKLIETEFVTSACTFRDLQERHGIDFHYIWRIANEQDWRSKREAFFDEACTQAREAAKDVYIAVAKAAANEALETVRDMASVRKKLLARVDLELAENPSDLRPIADRVSEIERIAPEKVLGADGKLVRKGARTVRRSVQRSKPRIDPRTLDSILRNHLSAVQTALGLDPKAPESETPIRIN